MQNVETS